MGIFFGNLSWAHSCICNQLGGHLFCLASASWLAASWGDSGDQTIDLSQPIRLVLACSYGKVSKTSIEQALIYKCFKSIACITFIIVSLTKASYKASKDSRVGEWHKLFTNKRENLWPFLQFTMFSYPGIYFIHMYFKEISYTYPWWDLYMNI